MATGLLTFFKNILSEHYQRVKHLDPDEDLHSVQTVCNDNKVTASMERAQFCCKHSSSSVYCVSNTGSDETVLMC